MELPCPACGAAVAFQSSISIFAVCPYCQSTLIRRDLNLETLGKMALPLNDTSPLQLGTEGRYRDIRFTLVGRVKKIWADGAWNEWFAWFDDGNHGWLAEAQGFYSIAFETTDAGDLPEVEFLAPERMVLIGERSYCVTDVKQCSCHFGEGELPFVCEPGQAMTSVDLVADATAFGCLEYTGESVRLYQGDYLPFETFQFSRLRELEGW